MPACRYLLIVSIAALLFSAARADDRLFELEQKAIRDAVARVEPSVVQIETIEGFIHHEQWVRRKEPAGHQQPAAIALR